MTERDNLPELLPSQSAHTPLDSHEHSDPHVAFSRRGIHNQKVAEKRLPSIPPALKFLLEFAIALIVALLVTEALKMFVVEPFTVPTGSMEPTVMSGDSIFTEKVSYLTRTPEKGEVIVFDDFTTDNRKLLKRVIATEGQTVELKGGAVYVDGNRLFEPYTYNKASDPISSQYKELKITYPYKVPAGELWVMGDNRTNSADSRYFGPIKTSDVIGRAFVVYFPFENFGLIG